MKSNYRVVEGGLGTSGGSGPEGPEMEQRVAKLEGRLDGMDKKLSSIDLTLSEIKSQMAKAADVAEIKGRLAEMPKANDWATLRAEIAEIKGKLSNIPTTIQLLTMLITTWTAGAAIVFALLRFTGKTP